MSKRAITYGRVSSDDRKKGGGNLQGQLEMYREYCQEKGYQILVELVEDERGASGADCDLPQLEKALDMARAGEFDVFVTRELDRLARGLAKQLFIEEQFKRYGAKIEYVLDEFPDTPEGNLNKNIKAVIAEYERLKTRQRTVRRRENKVRDGSTIVHGNAPFGFSIHKDGGHTSLVVNEKEAGIVRKVFGLYTNDERLSISAVAKLMEGTPSCADLRHNPSNPKKRKYGHWSASSVSHILANSTYRGRWEYGAKKIKAEVPPIISKETWKKAEARRSGNSKFASRHKYHFLLQGRLTCACGSSMLCMSRKWKDRVYRYYACGRSSGLQAEKCSKSKFWRADHIHDEILRWLTAEFSNPDNVRQTVQECIEKEYQEREDIVNRIATLKDLLAQNDSQLRRFLDAYADNPDLPKEWLAEKKRDHKSTFIALDQELNHWQGGLMLHQYAWEMFEEIGGQAEYWHKYLLALHGKDLQDRVGDELELVKSLDVKATLQMNEDGTRKILASCRLGDKTLSVSPTHLRTRGWDRQKGFVLSGVILLQNAKRRKPMPVFTEILGGAGADQPGRPIDNPIT